jgi:prepilin-type processing-associated H-X9-DG protein
MLLPALSSAREKARSIRCFSNQRQIMVDYKIAVDEGEGKLDGPEALDWKIRNLGKGEVWLCPSLRLDTTLPGMPGHVYAEVSWLYRDYASILHPERWREMGIDVSQVATGFRAGGYALNGWLIRPHRSYGYEREIHFVRSPDWHLHHEFILESRIRSPTMTPLLVDAVYPIVYPRITDNPAVITIRNGRKELGGHGMELVALPRHGSGSPKHFAGERTTLPGSANVGFYDGHIERVRLPRLWDLHWHNNYPTTFP